MGYSSFADLFGSLYDLRLEDIKLVEMNKSEDIFCYEEISYENIFTFNNNDIRLICSKVFESSEIGHSHFRRKLYIQGVGVI